MRPILNTQRAGPFMGSATTLIAADIDVAVERWQRFTGKAAVLDGSGESFNDLAGRYRTTRSASSASVTVPVLSLSLETPMPSKGPGSRP